MKKYIALYLFISSFGYTFACEKCDKLKEYIEKSYIQADSLYHEKNSDDVEIKRMYYASKKIYLDLLTYIQYLESHPEDR